MNSILSLTLIVIASATLFVVATIQAEAATQSTTQRCVNGSCTVTSSGSGSGTSRATSCSNGHCTETVCTNGACTTREFDR